LFLLQPRVRPVLGQSLVFTAAHILTLALASAGLVVVPGRIVEPLIALSIAAAAADNLRREPRLGTPRLGLVFACGLLHGFGFSLALAHLLRQPDGWLAPLAAVNLGVELAQITVILAAAGVFLLVPSRHHQRVRCLVSGGLLIVGLVLATARWWS
jgi:hypothetical protein